MSTNNPRRFSSIGVSPMAARLAHSLGINCMILGEGGTPPQSKDLTHKSMSLGFLEALSNSRQDPSTSASTPALRIGRYSNCRLCHAPPVRCDYGGGLTPARRRCYARAFTLIEMLVATVLSAVLISAVLQMLAGVSRDRKTLNHLTATQAPAGITELIRWDLSNAQSTSSHGGDVVIVGLNGIDPNSLKQNGRLVQVRYQLQANNLWRVQEYLDDAARPARWHELVAAGVSEFSIEPADSTSQMRLRLTGASGSIDQKIRIK